MGREFTLQGHNQRMVPLCTTHDRVLHVFGDEERWWKDQGMDAIRCAATLWRESRDGRTLDTWEPEGVPIEKTACLTQS